MSSDLDRDRLDAYIFAMGGATEVARRLKIDRSSLHRWQTGEVDIAPLMIAVLNMSDKNVDLHYDIQLLKDELEEMSKQIDYLQQVLA